MTTTQTPPASQIGTPVGAAAVEVPEPPNTVLSDLREACETYADKYLKVEIHAVNPEGGALNPGDTASFKVRVHNDGPLHLTGLTVLLSAEHNSVKVGRHGWADGQFSYQSAVVDTVPAHMLDGDWIDVPDENDDHFHFWVHEQLPVSDLVSVSVKDWNLDLLHLLDSHTDPSATAHDTYRAQVFPG